MKQWTKHEVHHELPRQRTVEQAMQHADFMEYALTDRVLPFQEDWDLVILAREIRRLRQMIDIP